MNRFLQLLGLATKAGRTVSGEFSVEQSVKKGRVCLVIVAADASDNTKKHFQDMCVYRDIPIVIACSKQELGHSTGKQERASVGVLDQGFADKLTSIIREGLI